MKTLHAFFVAINKYPKSPLNGCVNDMLRFKKYLERYAKDRRLEIRLKELIDEEATRKAVIDGFQHFQGAEDNDICLFFYAGHGSHWPAPKEFWHMEPDRRNESLVCVDSRNKGGRDLMDKELSYLVWEATKDKNVHFLAITDCCHSGTSFRKMEGVKERRQNPPKDQSAIPAKDYHGFKHYKKVGEDQYSPPRGRYIHIAAAQNKQTAKEVYVKDEPCGIFTYALVEALTAFRNQLSYKELTSRIGFRVRNAVKDQSPQLEALQTEDKDFFFLTDQKKEGPNFYLVAYDRKLGWALDAGALHGIKLGDDKSKTVLRLQDDHQITVTKVLADYSKVEGMENYDKKKSLKAVIVQRPIEKLLLTFAENCDKEGMQYLKDMLQDNSSDLFQLTTKKTEARYWIHIDLEEKTFYLTTPYVDFPLFKKIDGMNIKSAELFLNRLEHISKWVQVLELENPEKQIRDGEIQIEFFKVTDSGNEEDDAPKDPVDWYTSTKFKYVFQDGEWHKPAFQLKITNTGRRPLWVSLLFLGDNFGITNQLIQKEQLGPGESVWAADVFEGHPYRTIPLQVEEYYQAWGVPSINEYLKLFISTHEFYTDHFNQKGLDPAIKREGITRNLSPRKRVKTEVRAWATKTIPIEIIAPSNKKEN